MKVVVATRNQGKLAEFRRLFADVAGLELVSLADVGCDHEVVEDGTTFRDNALKKAQEIAQRVGYATLADDSGIEVDALGGKPGVGSARYAGEGASDADNNHKLLRELAGRSDRTARFRCVLAWVDANGQELAVTDGVCEGVIAFRAKGDGGFGYDPLFIPRGETRHMAELSPAEKHAISHRGEAARAMRVELQRVAASIGTAR